MTKPIFKFPEEEIRRYNRHGIAHADLNEMRPIPITGCTIDLTKLLEPAYAWAKPGENAPRIIIASDEAKSIPEDAVSLNSDRTLESLEVRIFQTDHRKEYGPVELIPVYKP